MALRAVDWQTLHTSPLISVPDCWKGCEGFCCANEHPDFQFRLLPGRGRGTTVIYLEDEYRWLKAHGHAICGEESGKELAALRFDFGGPEPLAIRFAPCGYLGRCDSVTKPLLCRIYPFMPVMGVDGEIEEVLPASIVDATLMLKGAPSHCPVTESPGSDALHAALARDPALDAALRHPTLILYTQAVRAFMESYRERLTAWEGFPQQGSAFWQAWELAYLGRRLVDRDRIAAHLLGVHERLIERYGPYPA